MGQVFPSVCPLDCPDTCGLLVEVEGGKVIKVTGDPEHPFTQGFICAKMRHYPLLIHSPERILTPLKRTGPKGSGQFKPISWEEALKEIACRWGEIIDTYGAEAILPYSYAGVMGLIQRNAGHPFFHRLGASILKRTICSPAADAGWQLVMGETMGTDPETVIYSDFIILWGTNSVSTNLHFASLVKRAQHQGARVVLIDVYRTRTASLADEVVLVKPGSDAALALGMMHVLAEEGLVDEDFLARYVVGYERLKAEVLPHFPSHRVEELTGVPAGRVINLAREYGKAKAPFIRIGHGLSRRSNGAMTIRAITCLPALVGAYRKKGGGALQSTGTGIAFNLEVITRPDLKPKPVREINMVQLGRALTSGLHPPIKSLYVYHANPAAVTPDQNRVIAGLSREDLFTVVHERFMTDTALYADLILPATFSVEQWDIYRSYGHFYIQMSRPVISPPGQAKSNWQTFCLLAQELGFEEDIFRSTEEELIRKLLASPTPFLEGISYNFLASGRPVRINTGHLKEKKFFTPSGKIEIYSFQALAKGQPALPQYIPLKEELKELYPFQLITAPAHYTLNSNFAQLKSLQDKEGGPHILVNPGDCRKKGLINGGWAEVYNHYGSCFLKVVETEDVPPGIVVAPGVWWLKDSPGKRNVNTLVGDELTDLGEGSTFYGFRVDLRRAF
ncbi:Anaerobic selenocysteine-containing dehydrogenase [Thermanaeromonas toyohensis ToBE]|uniref:Anaerobic selenocysteine-containing dehydrogenase n=1 Tax=Thermanaeromonas toyohensis ToBE TaxID=698762 RepID=A0A1W1VC01_9FIRM|nr:molybdopterin oxidoreductase family protein [Thermanaeromonas toyohensis]SMB90826.1 Anaerobic selenocysteine-containing dehydrogenase [Thermanaeromonas toyohensis ToBE]